MTGTFILNTLLFVAVARLIWGTSKRKVVPVAILFLVVEVAFFSSNIAKVSHGAWLSLAIGLILSIVMMTWRRGQGIVTKNRMAQEGSLSEFLDGLGEGKPPVACRVPGVAVFLGRGKATTPLALRAEVEYTRTLQEKVVIVTVDTVSIPHVEIAEQFMVEVLGHGLFKVFYVTHRVGYHDKLDVPEALRLCRMRGLLETNLDLEHAAYFVSRIAITPTDAPVMRRWRKKLFVAMARNASSPIEHFGLPADRTVMMGSQVAL